MGPVRFRSSRDHAALEDAVHSPLIRAMIEPLGDLAERQDRDPFDAAHPLGLGVIEEAVEPRGEEEISVCILHKFLVVPLRYADADWEEGLSDSLAHRDIDALQPDPSLLVRLRRSEKLPNAPSPVTTLVEATEQGVDVGPAARFIQTVVFKLVPSK